jgi:hypothetical protein
VWAVCGWRERESRKGEMAPGWAGACAWAVLGHDRGRRGVVVLAGLWAVGQKGFRGILEFEFEFEGSIQIQIPHIGITQNENPTTNSKQGRLQLNPKRLQIITLTFNGP